jgi:hypothetical protein
MRSLLTLFLFSTLGVTLSAQKAPKMDSLVIRLAKPKAEALDLVLAAFTNAGLVVSNQTSAMIESDQGASKDLLGDRYARVVRALVLGPDSNVTVLMAGVETSMIDGRQVRQAISNRSKGTAGKLWDKMLLAAAALDPKQVPPGAARP